MKIGAFEIPEPVPELREPYAIAMLRPWVDVGRVGSLVLRKLEKHLSAKELCRLARPGNFYNFTIDRPRMRMVEGKRVLSIPNTIVRYAHDEGSDRDFMFLHLREPHSMGEDFTDSVVELLEHFGATEYCRIGSMSDAVPHTRPLLVTGSIAEDHKDRTEGLVSVPKSTYQGPTSIVNLIGESLAGSDIGSTSLMLHLPHYVQLDEDHMGAARMMEVLGAMYGFPSSLAEPSRGKKQYADIDQAVANNSQVNAHVRTLEGEYDRTQQTREPEEELPFSPEVEKFLQQMGQQLEDGRPEGDG
jgi:hypothetical protein